MKEWAGKMLKFIVEYTIKARIFSKVIIEAATYTQAYILFMIKFPSDHEITEIREEKSPAEA